MHNYTRNQRLKDHKAVINNLIKSPPKGWNKKLIFVGGSEGGPLVTELTAQYPQITLATIHCSGASHYNWRDELWLLVKAMADDFLDSLPWYIKLRIYLPSSIPFSINFDFQKNRVEYDKMMDKTLADPRSEKEFIGMTYKDHTDALNWPEIDYKKLNSAYLFVSGDQDSFIESSDEFVLKAKLSGVDVTYLRVAGMDHYVRKRQDILDQSFDWLKQHININ